MFLQHKSGRVSLLFCCTLCFSSHPPHPLSNGGSAFRTRWASVSHEPPQWVQLKLTSCQRKHQHNKPGQDLLLAHPHSAPSFLSFSLSLSVSFQFNLVCFIGLNVRWTILPKRQDVRNNTIFSLVLYTPSISFSSFPLFLFSLPPSTFWVLPQFKVPWVQLVHSLSVCVCMCVCGSNGGGLATWVIRWTQSEIIGSIMVALNANTCH